MILNKSAVERGLAHGTLFKTEQLDLKHDKGKSQVCVFHLPAVPHLLCCNLWQMANFYCFAREFDTAYTNVHPGF